MINNMKKLLILLLLFSCKKETSFPSQGTNNSQQNKNIHEIYYLHISINEVNGISYPNTLSNDTIYYIETDSRYITNPIKNKYDTLKVNNNGSFYYGKFNKAESIVWKPVEKHYKEISLDYYYAGQHYYSTYRKEL